MPVPGHKLLDRDPGSWCFLQSPALCCPPKGPFHPHSSGERFRDRCVAVNSLVRGLRDLPLTARTTEALLMCFSLFTFPPLLSRPPPLLRSDPLQRLPALTGTASTRVAAAWAFGCGYRTVLLTATTKSLPLTAGAFCPASPASLPFGFRPFALPAPEVME